jgi:hypothetical protein
MPLITLAAVYFVFAASTPLNIGLRHLFPILPILSILSVGLIAQKRFIHKLRYGANTLLWTCFMAVLAELSTSFPHWISFFNLPARIYGPARILSDSNLDWGQDLPALAAWRRENPNGTLYLAYFGTADPHLAYGMIYTNLHGGYELGPPPTYPSADRPGYLVVSMTVLQGTYANAELRAFYQNLRQHSPVATLGQTLRVYTWPPASSNVIFNR